MFRMSPGWHEQDFRHISHEHGTAGTVSAGMERVERRASADRCAAGDMKNLEEKSLRSRFPSIIGVVNEEENSVLGTWKTLNLRT